MRKLTMTPLQPRTMGGLKGWGFTVTFEDHSTQPQGYGGTDAQASVESESRGGENVVPHELQIENSDVALAGEGRGADPVALGSAVEPGAHPPAHNDDFRQIPVIGEIH